MSSVKLTIKNADFSVNALGIIVESNINLDLLTSIRNYRGYSADSYENGDFSMFYTDTPADTWSSFAVDVSRFVGRKVSVTYNNGYSSGIHANGAFLNADAPAFTEGFGDVNQKVGSNTALNLQDYVLGLICPVTSNDDANTDLTEEYTIPVGAKWLVFTSKSAGVAIILAD